MNNRPNSARIALSLALMSLALRAAGAAPQAVSPADLAHCAVIAAADERLACFDTLAAPAAPVTPRAQETHTGTKAFGLTQPVAQAAPEGPQLIAAHVTQVSNVGLSGANVSVLLDNGQTWLLNASDVDLKAGDSVTVKRAALGSFLLIIGRHSYRVRRLQ
jgi:hypothetical protein